MMKQIINSSHVSFSYGNSERKSLRNVTLSIKEGECIVLCGKSGSGKTTFSRLLNGLCPMFFDGSLEGECIVDGLKAGETAIEKYVHFVGSVFQNPKTQYFNTNSTAELAFPCENVGMEPGLIREKVEACAKSFQIEHLMNRSLFQMSGGEKQRIAFASACMLSPGLLVLDEPTSNLDADGIAGLHDMLLRMKEQGVTIVVAEHRLAWLVDVADRYMYFEDGELLETLDAVSFRALSAEELNRRGLRATDLSVTKEATKQKEGKASQKDALLSTQNLAIGYDKKSPVYQLPDVSLCKGEIVGLMGKNGIGKTTLAKTLCGLQKPLQGEILFCGKKLSNKKLTEETFLVMQDVNYQLFADSVKEEILLGAKEPEKMEEVLNLLGLTELAERHPMSLSGGQKQRVAIASALVSGKKFVILDEPTSGLDYYHMMQVGKLLTLLKEQGKCVLVITHDEELTANWCDRIIRLEATKL